MPVVINEFKKPEVHTFSKLRRVSLISETFLTRGISEKVDDKKCDVRSVSSSYSNSFIVDNGKLYSIGVNVDGMLGIGNTNIMFISEIIQVKSFKAQVAGVSAGANHCLAWTQNGKLYSWGRYRDGCLGYTCDQSHLESLLFWSTPTLVESLKDFDVKSAVAGRMYSMCLTAQGRIYSWGRLNPRLGTSTSEIHVPENPFRTPRFMHAELIFHKIAGGPDHCAALTENAELFLWGRSSSGCLGRPPSEKIKSTRIICYPPNQVDLFLGVPIR